MAEKRRLRNELLFREVNERLEDAAEDPAQSHAELLCECGRLDCTSTVAVTNEAYEAVRADPTHFIVIEDHVNPEIERIFGRHEDYVVVEKIGEAADVARQSDPRRGETRDLSEGDA